MTDPAASLPHYLNEEECAVLIGIAPATLMTWRSRSKGPPYIKAGGAVRYSRTSVHAWMKANEVNPSPSQTVTPAEPKGAASEK